MFLYVVCMSFRIYGIILIISVMLLMSKYSIILFPLEKNIIYFVSQFSAYISLKRDTLLVFFKKELCQMKFLSVLLFISYGRILNWMTTDLFGPIFCSLLCLLSSENINYSCFFFQAESMIISLLENASFSQIVQTIQKQ